MAQSTGNENIHVYIEGEVKEPIEINYRTGTAEKLHEPQQFKLNVLVSSIGEYIAKAAPDEMDMPVIVACTDPAGPFIEYREHINHPLGTILRADLKEHPDFTAWGINDGLKFGIKELANHIRKYAHTFLNLDEAKTFIKSLQNFEVKYEQCIIREDDRQGKTKDVQESAIKVSKGELPKTFALSMPLFRGTDPVNITVEIEIDKGQNNMPVFSFYSMDVEILAREVVKDTIEKEIDRFRDKFPILYV